jgi:hypothetical protein
MGVALGAASARLATSILRNMSSPFTFRTRRRGLSLRAVRKDRISQFTRWDEALFADERRQFSEEARHEDRDIGLQNRTLQTTRPARSRQPVRAGLHLGAG